MHGFRWLVRGMVDIRVFMKKNKLSYLICGGSTVLLCARLFADSASLVPHVAAHMKCCQITYENLVMVNLICAPCLRIFWGSW